MLNRIFSAVLFLHSYTFGLFAYYYYYYYKERQRFAKTPRARNSIRCCRMKVLRLNHNFTSPVHIHVCN